MALATFVTWDPQFFFLIPWLLSFWQVQQLQQLVQLFSKLLESQRQWLLLLFWQFLLPKWVLVLRLVGRWKLSWDNILTLAHYFIIIYAFVNNYQSLLNTTSYSNFISPSLSTISSTLAFPSVSPSKWILVAISTASSINWGSMSD